MTPEERKEARAHRNRIAAQNSRDRRKMHYATLEARIAQLEAENQQLRAQSPPTEIARENAELRERIKTLENGWQTVLTALAAQGLPLGPMPPAPPQSVPTELNTSETSVASSMTFPPSPALTFQSSPQESLQHEFESPSPLAFAPTPLLDMPDFDMASTDAQSSLLIDPSMNSDATCHLARMVNTSSQEVSLQRVASASVPAQSPAMSLALSSVRITPAPSSSHPMIRRWRISSVKSSSSQPRRLYLRVRVPIPKCPPTPPYQDN